MAPAPLLGLLSFLASLWHSVVASFSYVFGYSEATLRKRMAHARTYTEWKSAARIIDNAHGFLEWRSASDNRVHNNSEITRRLAEFKVHLAKGDAAMLVDELQYDFHRAMCGIHNPLLYTKFPSGTKSNVRELATVITKTCKIIADDVGVPLARKRKMVSHITQAYGSSALVLDSSAAFGAFEVGVVKALHEAGVLPRVIFGSGSGALVASFACCDRDISRLFNVSAINFDSFQKRGQKGSLSRKIKRLWAEGALMDINVLQQFAKDNIGEITFKEAYERTGRVLNVAVSVYNAEFRTRSVWLLNYLTAPDVLVYSAACASCATPLVYPQCDILQRMIDGTVVKAQPATLRWSTRMESLHVNDVIGRIRGLFGVNNFIVAEATLLRLPFLSLNPKGFLSNPLTTALAFVTEEVWRAVAALSRLPFLQSRLTGVLQSMRVPVVGDIVLNPVGSVADMLRLVSNPDQALLDYCMWKGEQKVWPHLERIKIAVQIENALHDLTAQLSTAAEAAGAGGEKTFLPSPATGSLGW